MEIDFDEHFGDFADDANDKVGVTKEERRSDSVSRTDDNAVGRVCVVDAESRAGSGD